MSDVRAIQPYLDFGGVRLELSGQTLDFGEELNTGRASFQDVFFRKQVAITRKRVQRFIGIDVTIQMTLANLQSTDYQLVSNLLSMINDSHYYNDPIVIYPRYNAASAYPWGIACWLNSSLEAVDIDRICSGQKLELTWVAEELISEYPMIFSQTTADTALSEAGDEIITEDSNNIEIER